MEDSPLLKMPPVVILTKARRYLTGVALLLSVVLLWTTSNFITADLETGEGSWNKPFLITYVNTASFVFYLIPTIWRYLLGRPLRPNHRTDEVSYRPLSQDPASPKRSRTRRSASLTRPIPVSPRASLHLLDQSRSSSPVSTRIPSHPIDVLPSSRLSQDLPVSIPDIDETEIDGDRPLSIRETAVIAAWWSAVWFVANYAVNASLGMTSVASVTILSSTSGFFTLGLGSYMGSEKVDPINGFAVIASFIGVVLVTTSDSKISSSSTDLPPYPLLGDMAALLSAAFYAVYVILLKVKVGNEDRADMQLMLGFAGLFNIVFLLPAFPLLHYSGWETFELPPTGIAWAICGVNMFITLSSDYLYMLAMLKTSPMLVTIGLSLTIPLALIGSLILPNTSSEAITLYSMIGAALVFVGFGMLGWQGWKETQIVEERPE